MGEDAPTRALVPASDALPQAPNSSIPSRGLRSFLATRCRHQQIHTLHFTGCLDGWKQLRFSRARLSAPRSM